MGALPELGEIEYGVAVAFAGEGGNLHQTRTGIPANHAGNHSLGFEQQRCAGPHGPGCHTDILLPPDLGSGDAPTEASDEYDC